MTLIDALKRIIPQAKASGVKRGNEVNPNNEGKIKERTDKGTKNVNPEDELVEIKDDKNTKDSRRKLLDDADKKKLQDKINEQRTKKKASVAAKDLYNAMKGLGTKNDIVEKYLGEDGLNDAELRATIEEFEKKYGEGETFKEWVEGEYTSQAITTRYLARIEKAMLDCESHKTSQDGNYGEAFVTSLAKRFYNAVKGIGTNEVDVYMIMSLDGDLLEQVQMTYNDTYADSYKKDSDFFDAIKSEFGKKEAEELINKYYTQVGG